MWENIKFSLNTLGLKCLLIMEKILSMKEKRQICRLGSSTYEETLKSWGMNDLIQEERE